MDQASAPLDWRLFLPKSWDDRSSTDRGVYRPQEAVGDPRRRAPAPVGEPTTSTPWSGTTSPECSPTRS
nr:hypothetical protein [Rhodococcus wratislaviensis]